MDTMDPFESIFDMIEDEEPITEPNRRYALPDWMTELEDSTEEEIPESDAIGNDTPAYGGMLGMYLRSPNGQSRVKRVIDGRFICIAGEYKYVSSDSGRGGAGFQVIRFNPKIKPLIDYLVKNKTNVQLTTRRGANNREIEVIDLIQEPRSIVSPRSSDTLIERDPEQPLFRSMVYRLLKGNEKKHAPIKPRKLFTTIGELRMLLDVCRGNYPEEIVEWAEDNLARYEMGSLSISEQEKNHIRTALTYILNIDWDFKLPPMKSIDEIKADLDARFYGLDSVKVRILEIIAQLQHTQELPRWGILLCGAAGTGKTTIAEAFAAALNLQLVRIDMSSITDVDTLTGASRIYSNAKPGYVIYQLFVAGKSYVVVCINELDKAVGRGDGPPPSDALLTLMDGLGFIDNFIECAIPTDGMFFIATCNDPDKISKPILDRFLRIDIPAYSQDEKQVILEDYIVPKLLSENHLTTENLSLSKEAVKLLCSSYAVEPGVRDLQQYTEKIVSHYLLEKANNGPESVCYSADEIRYLLGPSAGRERNFSTRPGLVLSAFVHEGAAHTFPVEAIVFPGSGAFTTINIPEGPIKDFCTAAYLCARRETKAIDFTKLDVSLYVPQAIPITQQNYIGTAVYAAITSAVGQMQFINKAAFIGGCDLYGNLFLDETSISPILNAFSAIGITTVYAPRGSGQLIYGHCADGIEIIESDSMLSLIKMALCTSAKESSME